MSRKAPVLVTTFFSSITVGLASAFVGAHALNSMKFPGAILVSGWALFVLLISSAVAGNSTAKFIDTEL